jgi:hypothetical protein
MQLLQVVLMYLASVPVVITLRQSAVVEEELPEDFDSAYSSIKDLPKQVVDWLKRRHFMLRQASLLFLFLMTICIAEDKKFQSSHFDMFKVIYETASAFGTVGLSIGYPGTVTSFSARFTLVSKALMIIIMLMGRHRGLPTNLDTAIQLPSKIKEIQREKDKDQEKDEQIDDVKSEYVDGSTFIRRVATVVDAEGQIRKKNFTDSVKSLPGIELIKAKTSPPLSTQREVVPVESPQVQMVRSKSDAGEEAKPAHALPHRLSG